MGACETLIPAEQKQQPAARTQPLLRAVPAAPAGLAAYAAGPLPTLSRRRGAGINGATGRRGWIRGRRTMQQTPVAVNVCYKTTPAQLFVFGSQRPAPAHGGDLV